MSSQWGRLVKAGGTGSEADGFGAFIPLIIVATIAFFVIKAINKARQKRRAKDVVVESTCEDCGIVYTEGEKFCKECGNALKTVERKAENQTEHRREIVMLEKSSAAGITIFFGIIGVCIGIPVSYYFQNPMIRKVPLIEYIKHIPEILQKPNQGLGDMATPVIVSCAICGLVMGITGYFIAKARDK